MDPRSQSSDTQGINLRWLVQLRWGAIVGQSAVILLVDRAMAIRLPLVALFAVIGLEAASNVACMLWLGRAGPRNAPEWALAALMALDMLLLTALLQLSGGSFNPFNFLYLVHIALAAVILRPRWTWGLVVLSAACFGALFGEPFGLGDVSKHMDHAHQMQMHLQGMWVAYAVAAVFIVYFVGRIRRALAQRDAELARQREKSVRDEKLASLATLAAGAAHELSTPLGTIAIAAGEIEAALARGDVAGSREDARLIREQVQRCRAILDQMSTDAGDSPGEAPVVMRAGELIDAAVDGAAAVNVVGETDAEVRVPQRATAQALRGLIVNARHASQPGDSIEVAVTAPGEELWIEVRDRGAGMPPEVLARAGEPFFTTKEPGCGMGLGLFLVHALADRLGGRLELDSTAGEGTVARLILPRHRDATIHRIAEGGAVAETSAS